MPLPVVSSISVEVAQLKVTGVVTNVCRLRVVVVVLVVFPGVTPPPETACEHAESENTGNIHKGLGEQT